MQIESCRLPSLEALRNELYLGKGYVVLRGWLQPEQALYMQTFWQNHSNKEVHKFVKQDHLFPGCEDVSIRRKDRIRHFGYFWNKPKDPLTYAAAWKLQSLRNQIEGNPPGKDFLPLYPKYRRNPDVMLTADYRLVFTDEGGAVGEHVDLPLDHSRIQFELMLSNYGEDYSGGFAMRETLWGGEMVNLCEKENLKIGDVLIFQYARPHEVLPVESPEGGSGFCRMLLPLENIALKKPPDEEPGFFSRFQKSNTPDWDDAAYKDGKKRYYSEAVEPYMKVAIQEGVEPSEVYYHRGLWARYETFQHWQYEALVDDGLQPEHKVLDLGCGILRLAEKLVPYLDEGNYYGIDPVQSYLDAGARCLKELAGVTRTYEVLCRSDADASSFGCQFDYAMAHSVFTHLSESEIRSSLERLKRVMKSGGILIFTYAAGSTSEKPVVYAGGHPVTMSKQQDFKWYQALGDELGIAMTDMVKSDHPTQHVVKAVFP